MTTLFYKKKFYKSFAKQPKKIQNKAIDILEILEIDEFHTSLRRHKLKGKKYKNIESIDVTGDIRIIIQPQTMEIIDICDIGSHAQLYK